MKHVEFESFIIFRFHMFFLAKYIFKAVKYIAAADL